MAFRYVLLLRSCTSLHNAIVSLVLLSCSLLYTWLIYEWNFSIPYKLIVTMFLNLQRTALVSNLFIFRIVLIRPRLFILKLMSQCLQHARITSLASNHLSIKFISFVSRYSLIKQDNIGHLTRLSSNRSLFSVYKLRFSSLWRHC